MMSVDELGNATIMQVLQYHGLCQHECPIDPKHELTVASDTYAICHSCAMEWEVIGLHLELNTIETLRENDGEPEYLQSGVTSPSAVIATESEELVQPPVEITDDFVTWVRGNREHIVGSPEYDGNAENAIGVLTEKDNLCLLSWVTEDLTHAQIRRLEELWKQRDLIRLPKSGGGIKRSERIPMEIRRVRKYSPTVKVYTFHRRETLEMLGIEDEYSRKVTHSA